MTDSTDDMEMYECPEEAHGDFIVRGSEAMPTDLEQLRSITPIVGLLGYNEDKGIAVLRENGHDEYADALELAVLEKQVREWLIERGCMINHCPAHTTIRATVHFCNTTIAQKVSHCIALVNAVRTMKEAKK